MADLKISQLTSATLPLAGTEVLPIVQSGATVKVSVANLTAGRAVGMAGGSFTDNLTQSTAAKGINFTANTPAAGMTSQLLNWYEEGTWTPTDGSGAGLSITYANCVYTRIGRVVTLCGQVTIPANASGLSAAITGLPFTSPYQYMPGNNLNPTADSANIAIATDRLVFYTSPYTVQSTNTSVVGTHYIQITYQV